MKSKSKSKKLKDLMQRGPFLRSKNINLLKESWSDQCLLFNYFESFFRVFLHIYISGSRTVSRFCPFCQIWEKLDGGFQSY